MPKQPLIHQQQGFTLLELAVVLVVLIGLAGLLVPYVSNTSSRSACIATDTSLVAIRNAIIGNFENPGYFQDMGRLPITLDELFQQAAQAGFNPITKLGWRGPYLVSAQTEDAFLTDSKIIIQVPVDDDSDSDDCDDLGYANDSQCARLISDGPNGTPDTQPIEADGSSRVDDHILYLFIPDQTPTLAQNCTSL